MMIDRLRQIRPGLLSLALIGAASAPALADAYANDDHYVRETYVTTTTVRPGYGFNGAYQEMTREMAAQPTYYSGPTYVTPTYTYTPNGYVYSGPVRTYTYTYQPAPTVTAYAPALSKDTIKDRLDDQGYDDIKVGDYDNGFYNVFAEDRDDHKVLLKVDASTGYVASTQYLR